MSVNLTAVLAMISAVGQLLPILIQAMQAIESAIPESGAGGTKLALVKAWMEKAFEGMNLAATTFGAVWPILETTAETLVAWYNSTGVFKKGPSA